VAVSLVGFVAIGAAPDAKNVAPPKKAATKAKAAAKPDKPRVIVGRVENVVLEDVHLKMKARIDTGAGVSSVHAKILEITQTDDGEYVRFQLEDAEGNKQTLKRKVVSWLNIKVMGSEERNRRPTVRLDVCIGGKKLKGRVNLNDRSNFIYPMLVGRNLLNMGKFLVDPSATFLQKPDCE
jgi:hypothetical protein